MTHIVITIIATIMLLYFVYRYFRRQEFTTGNKVSIRDNGKIITGTIIKDCGETLYFEYWDIEGNNTSRRTIIIGRWEIL